MTFASTDYHSIRTAVEDAFSALYLIEVASLKKDQMEVHQGQLSAAYIAVLRLRKNEFAALTKNAKDTLSKLQPRVEKLQAQLAGLKKATAVLKVVSGVLDIFTSIAKILK